MITAIITGLVVGGVFSLLNIPIPAPNKIEGILGIVGIFLGYLLIQYLRKVFLHV